MDRAAEAQVILWTLRVITPLIVITLGFSIWSVVWYVRHISNQAKEQRAFAEEIRQLLSEIRDRLSN